MQVSGEIRWFWREDPPPGLFDWFHNATLNYCEAGGGKLREDKYLEDVDQVELGIKYRGGGVGADVKGLVGIGLDDLAEPPFIGRVEIWSKWVSAKLELSPYQTITIQKRRWLRKFDTDFSMPKEIPLNLDERPVEVQPLPSLGCNVELTQISLQVNEVWWTLGFEAFGPLDTVATQLKVVAHELSARNPPTLGDGILASYPEWLKIRTGMGK